MRTASEQSKRVDWGKVGSAYEPLIQSPGIQTLLASFNGDNPFGWQVQLFLNRIPTLKGTSSSSDVNYDKALANISGLAVKIAYKFSETVPTKVLRQSPFSNPRNVVTYIFSPSDLSKYYQIVG